MKRVCFWICLCVTIVSLIVLGYFLHEERKLLERDLQVYSSWLDSLQDEKETMYLDSLEMKMNKLERFDNPTFASNPESPMSPEEDNDRPSDNLEQVEDSSSPAYRESALRKKFEDSLAACMNIIRKQKDSINELRTERINQEQIVQEIREVKNDKLTKYSGFTSLAGFVLTIYFGVSGRRSRRKASGKDKQGGINLADIDFIAPDCAKNEPKDESKE